MDNQELLNQVLGAMERQSEKTKNEIMEQVAAAMQEQTEVLTKMVQDVEIRINIKIENEVTKRIDSLFDGYKLVHEKQWELEHEMIALRERLERLEAKVAG